MSSFYYITSEISPFTESYSLAKFSRHTTQYLNENEEDIRVIIPRYGNISPRKYILREVIRLREIPVEYNEEDLMANIRSAFVPRSKVQVYFLEHDAFFSKKKTPMVFKARNGRAIKENPSRFAYFGKIALTTLEHLYWKPELFICHDWHGALIPVLRKEMFSRDDYCCDAKTMLCIHEIDEFSEYLEWPRSVLLEVGLPETKIEELIGSADTFSVLELGLSYADNVTIINKNPKSIVAHPAIQSVKKKLGKALRTIKLPEEEDWEKIAKEFHETCLNALE